MILRSIRVATGFVLSPVAFFMSVAAMELAPLSAGALLLFKLPLLVFHGGLLLGIFAGC